MPDRQANTRAVAKRVAASTPARSGGGTLLDALRRNEEQFARALPSVLDPERFLRQAETTIRTTPTLLECDVHSVLGAFMLAAQLGLEPGGPLGHAYLVPFREKGGPRKAQFIIGYKGYIDLARRSGNVQSIVARPVHTGDHFTVEYGLDDRLEHTPVIDGDPGELRLTYAVAKYQGGGHSFELATMADILKARDRSKAGSSGPWVTDFEAMALKTAVRRLAKWLPLSVEVQRAIAVDEAIGLGIDARIDDYGQGDVIDLDDTPTPPPDVPVEDDDEAAMREAWEAEQQRGDDQ